jgi:hypothetical protein
MRKLSIILIMALILGIVPLVSFTPEASANSLSTISSSLIKSPSMISSYPNPDVTISVYKATYIVNVTESVYVKTDAFVPDTSGKAFVLNGYEGKIFIEVSSNNLVGHTIEYTIIGEKDGAAYKEDHVVNAESTKVSFNEIEIGAKEQIFLKIGSSFPLNVEHEVYFIGKIPPGKGILKVQARNSINNPNQFYLQDLEEYKSTKIGPLFNTIDFYLLPATTLSTDSKYPQIIKILDNSSEGTREVPIPTTVINVGQVNNLDIYTSKDITLKLSSKPTEVNKFVVAPIYESNSIYSWLFYFFQLLGDGKMNTDGEVTFHDVPLGVWWFTPIMFGEDSKWSNTFGARVEIVPAFNNNAQILQIPIKTKSPSGKFDIRDVVGLTSQAIDNDQESGFFKGLLYGVRSMVVDDSNDYFDFGKY